VRFAPATEVPRTVRVAALRSVLRPGLRPVSCAVADAGAGAVPRDARAATRISRTLRRGRSRRSSAVAVATGCSRTTSTGRLSSRNPWNVGCLRWPSFVQPVNSTSATFVGVVQCTPRAS
jgi:hypothetical protein